MLMLSTGKISRIIQKSAQGPAEKSGQNSGPSRVRSRNLQYQSSDLVCGQKCNGDA